METEQDKIIRSYTKNLLYSNSSQIISDKSSTIISKEIINNRLDIIVDEKINMSEQKFGGYHESIVPETEIETKRRETYAHAAYKRGVEAGKAEAEIERRNIQLLIAKLAELQGQDVADLSIKLAESEITIETLEKDKALLSLQNIELAKKIRDAQLFAQQQDRERRFAEEERDRAKVIATLAKQKETTAVEELARWKRVLKAENDARRFAEDELLRVMKENEELFRATLKNGASQNYGNVSEEIRRYMNFQDELEFFKILGINPIFLLGKTEDEIQTFIKERHKALLRAYHPDSGGNVEDMKTLNIARDVLMNPQSRREYLDGHPKYKKGK